MKAVVSKFKSRLQMYDSGSYFLDNDEESYISTQKEKVKQLETALEDKDLKYHNWMKVVERFFSVRSLFLKSRYVPIGLFFANRWSWSKDLPWVNYFFNT